MTLHQKYYLLLAGTLSLGIFGFLTQVPQSFAANIGSNDCQELNRVPRNGYENLSSAYPQELFETAVQNHANYCCQQKDFPISQDMRNYCVEHPREDFAESPRLYDHLVDVAFRYLDGVEKLQYDGTPIDERGKERVERIEELGKDPNGAIPLVIREEYKNYRGDNTLNAEILQSQTQSCKQSLPRLRQHNTDRNDLPLAKKYFLICEISACIASDEKNKLVPACQEVAQRRIEEENDHTQKLLSSQGAQAINKQFYDYAMKYLTYDRMDEFLKKVVTMAKGLGFVDQKVPELTRICSG